MSNVAAYKSSYTTFSGADIVAVVHDRVVGELQGISYSVTREKVPVYTMGSPDPRSFSRGKRGIAGSMVFTVFNKDSFEDFQGDESITTIHTASGNKLQSDGSGGFVDNGSGITLLSVDQWEDAVMAANALFTARRYNYADEIFPFDVTITLHNEYGQAARFSVLGCEILNEGMGLSIDDITTEKACTFVARGLSKLKALTDAGGNAIPESTINIGGKTLSLRA